MRRGGTARILIATVFILLGLASAVAGAPALSWNTFLGDTGLDDGTAVAVDAGGNVYVAGQSTTSWGSPIRPFSGANDVFVAKLDPSGVLLWNTFLGGTAIDGYPQHGHTGGMAVAPDGGILVTGSSSGTWGAPIRPHVGAVDTFVAKLGSDGSLAWNTFVGGAGNDFSSAIALDQAGNIRVAGTSSAAWGAPVRGYTALDDLFVAGLTADGVFTWNTFLGGLAYESWGGIAVDSGGTTFVAGDSYPEIFSEIPATWGSPIAPLVGDGGAFAARLDAAGSLVWSTFLGGAYASGGVAVDPAGYFYVTGMSHASWGTPVHPFSGWDDVFVAKFGGGGDLVWNSFIGGAGSYDKGLGVTIDAAGTVLVLGESNDDWGTPLRPYAGGGYDAFVAALDAGGELVWNTLLGGRGADSAYGMAADAAGNIYVAGTSAEPWANPVHPYGGMTDAFVAVVLAQGAPNSPPVAADRQAALLEDQSLSLVLSAADAMGDSLSYAVVAQPAHGGLSGLAPNPTYTPEADFNGTDGFTYRANDGLADGNVATVTITVVGVNDAPSFVKGGDQTVLEDAALQEVPAWAVAISPGAENERAQSLGFSATTDNDALFAEPPAIDPDGRLTYRPAANAHGSATVTVTLADDGGTDHGGVDRSGAQTFTVTVTPVNDAPGFTQGVDIFLPEQAGPQTIAAWATDIRAGPANEAGQGLAFAVTTDNGGLFAARPALSPAGTLTFTPQAGMVGVAHVTATLRDDGGTAGGGADTSAAATFTITIGDDRPYAVATASPAAVHCAEGVVCDGSASFHGGSSHGIASFAWDLHYAGAFDEEVRGAGAAIAYGELGAHTAALRVADDASPPRFDIATTEVTVANRAPEAQAGGPYIVRVGRPLALSAAASSDPDQPCADAIVSYAWELDGDGLYDDAAGVAPKLGWAEVTSLVCGGACVPGTSHDIGVRVTDRPGLSSTARATVGVLAASARLTVTWPNGGEFLGTGRLQTVRWVSGPDVDSVRVLLSPDGKNWRTIVSQARASLGTAAWTPPPAEYRVTRRSWLIRVQGYAGGAPVASDVSDAPFGIGPLDVSGVEKGAEIRGGSQVVVRWARHRPPAKVAYTKFRYSLDGGRSWRSERVGGNPGEYLWKVPSRRSRTEGCRAAIELYSGWGALVGRDAGEGTFTILGGVDVTAPEGGDSVSGGTSRTVYWDTIGLPIVPVSSTKLRVTFDGGATWTDLASIPGNPGHWHWQVPVVPAPVVSGRIEVTLLDATGGVIAADRGEGSFTVLSR